MLCFFNDTATTEISTLSLPDPLPICLYPSHIDEEVRSDKDHPEEGHREAKGTINDAESPAEHAPGDGLRGTDEIVQDRKSTRLNSSHANISYAVFCLKKQLLQKTEDE